jgi:RNA polymerase sigma-70 factor (ECF subfamily)
MDSPSEAHIKNNPSSELLMLEYAKGDSNAFTELYEMHKGPLYRFIIRQGISSVRAEELFQEIWLKVINARNSYKATARFQTWLYRIARNHLIDEFRKTTHNISTEPLNEQVEVLNSNVLDSLETLHSQRQQKRLVASVEALPLVQREAFLLRYEAGMSISDIAIITDTNLETAKSRVRYAVKQLRKNLEDHNDKS